MVHDPFQSLRASEAVLCLCVLLPLCVLACSRSPSPAQPRATLPQTSGTIAVDGLSAPVRVVRDRAGVPHIYAASDADLFFAQGFVQAQDRLFQMDLWRRASQGRLAEILGANFIDRDAMTRRIQYRGDINVEWTSYGPETRTIAEAFVRGINAWVSIVREQMPEEFTQARWPPSYWRAEDLLNRTDAFLESHGALEQIRRERMPDAVAEAVRMIGTPPFLAGSSPPDPLTHTRTSSVATASRERVVVSEAPAALSAPSARYLVHLVAPGWNVVGATAPWLPGVAIGHNDRVAWGMTPGAVETERVRIEPAAAVTVGAPELMRVKGRAQMLPFTRDATDAGLVIASDKEHARVFVLQWRGFEPGTAAGLGALALDRARDAGSFRQAAAQWQMPPRRMLFADVEGHVGEDGAPGAATDRARSVERIVEGPSVVFPHLFRRFDVGPVPRPSDDAPLQLAMDVAAWDRSRAISAPGQSGAPASPHYSDAATLWSSGRMVELWFSEEAVKANAEATLTLIPAPRR